MRIDKTMKISVIISTFVLVIPCLLACNKAETEGPQDRIAFSVAVGPASTKAGTSTYSGAAFGSYAWKTSDTWEATSTESRLANPYMANAQTTENASKWYPENFRWPSATANLHFACYAPYKAKSPMTYDVTNGICFTDYTIDYSAAAEDLLYSDLSKNNTSGTSAIVFHHALCQIVVKLKTDEIPSGLTSVVNSAEVTLKSLSVSGIKSKGSFTQNASTKWSSQSDTSSYSIFSGTKLLSTTPDESCAAFYVIPQAFESGVQAINLNYDVKLTYNGGKTATKTGISETHYFTDLSLSNSWERGKQVNYTITVSAFGDELSFSASTEDWTQTSISGNLGGGVQFKVTK